MNSKSFICCETKIAKHISVSTTDDIIHTDTMYSIESVVFRDKMNKRDMIKLQISTQNSKKVLQLN